MIQQATAAKGMTFTNQDILPHINAPDSLAQKVSSIAGCFTFLAYAGCKLDGCYAVNNNSVEVSVELKTPIGDLTLGRAKLDPQNPSVTLGGSIDSFKAEATLTFSFSSYQLKACGIVCAPIVGCASGCASVNLAE